LPEDKRQ